MVGKVLMPKATAVWLIDNTSLTFEQIAEFCGLHVLEVQALADREATDYVVGLSPIINGMLTLDDIKKVEKDEALRLSLNKNSEDFIRKSREVKSRYTPMAHRQSRPDAILWIIKNHPDISDTQVAKLVRSTKTTVQSIRDRNHKSMGEIQARNPVILGICSEFDLRRAIEGVERKVVLAEKKEIARLKKIEKAQKAAQ